MEGEEEFALEAQEESTATEQPAKKEKAKKGKKRKVPGEPAQIVSYRYPDKRVNNPEVGMVHAENDPDQPETVWRYDPHIDPALQFDSARSRAVHIFDPYVKYLSFKQSTPFFSGVTSLFVVA